MTLALSLAVPTAFVVYRVSPAKCKVTSFVPKSKQIWSTYINCIYTLIRYVFGKASESGLVAGFFGLRRVVDVCCCAFDDADADDAPLTMSIGAARVFGRFTSTPNAPTIAGAPIDDEPSLVVPLPESIEDAGDRPSRDVCVDVDCDPYEVLTGFSAGIAGLPSSLSAAERVEVRDRLIVEVEKRTPSSDARDSQDDALEVRPLTSLSLTSSWYDAFDFVDVYDFVDRVRFVPVPPPFEALEILEPALIFSTSTKPNLME